MDRGGSPARSRLPRGIGLWAGFLDRLPAAEAMAVVRDVEAAGTETVWLPEYSGVDPFVRAALYLGATQRMTVALGVATIHARDPEAMVAAAATLEEAFPGRFLLGMGASHGHLAAARGHEYRAPLATMRDYLAAMQSAVGERHLPPRVLGALGPRMMELAGRAVDGAHTYFAPVAHTAGARSLLGPAAWLGPSQMVAIETSTTSWREAVRPYLRLCLGMGNYRRNLVRHGLTANDLDSVSDRLVDALVVPDDPLALRARVTEQHAAGADHVVLQFVPPSPSARVLERVAAGVAALG